MRMEQSMSNNYFRVRSIGLGAVVVLLVAAGCVPSGRSETERALAGVPEGYREDIITALETAGENKPEILRALNKAKKSHKEAVAFLVANMPARDLQALTGKFILDNVKLAYKARKKVPWGAEIPDKLFFNYVLPYASANERRDDWRKDFWKKFFPLVKDFETAAEAAIWLNKGIFKTVNVQYHATRRPKPDQSPYESMQAGYASCTGLSILMIDGCRAVCIPARLVGVPSWATEKPGNHNWAEIWDGQWYFVGASESKELNKGWFVKHAAHADPDSLYQRIYAASFKKTSLHFPLVWDLDIDYVSARNVTTYYTARKNVAIEVLDEPAGRPVDAVVTLYLDGELYARGRTGAMSKDGDGLLRFEIPGGETYEAAIEPPNGGIVKKTFQTSDEQDQKVTLVLSE